MCLGGGEGKFHRHTFYFPTSEPWLVLAETPPQSKLAGSESLPAPQLLKAQCSRLLFEAL